jgi:predicted nucleic acid-binding protein
VTAIDTSVLIAAFASWHEFHTVALRTCQDDPFLPTHSYVEAYSSLTRLPEPFRAPADVVSDYLHRRWSHRLISPTNEMIARLPQTLQAAGVTGGSTYDGVVGLTARDAGLRLVSLDRRARRTYQLLDVSHEILAS